MNIPFLALNYYDSMYFIIYFCISVSLLVYKVERYVLPLYAVDTEAIALVLFAIAQYLRYRLGELAVAVKEPRKVVFYLISSFFVILVYIFQIRLQTYILLTDFVVNWVGIGFTISEFISAIWLLAIFKRKKNAP